MEFHRVSIMTQRGVGGMKHFWMDSMKIVKGFSEDFDEDPIGIQSDSA